MARGAHQAKQAAEHFSDDVETLLDQYSPPQRLAVYLTARLVNQYMGVGLFDGVARYQVLDERMRQASMGARDLSDWLSTLCTRMRWSTPSAASGRILIALLSAADGPAVLAVLRRQSTAVVMVARAVAGAKRETRKALAASISAEIAAIDAAVDEAPQPDDATTLAFARGDEAASAHGATTLDDPLPDLHPEAIRGAIVEAEPA